jgi:hypothetical protein
MFFKDPETGEVNPIEAKKVTVTYYEELSKYQ